MNNHATAHIALNNNRIKTYADFVYLKDGDEFQIELYNPYQVSVLARIYVNDNLISASGLVIRPGQRYFLDRYIDKNQKFKFNTYELGELLTPEVEEAIKKNGSVKVEFYKEFVPVPPIFTPSPPLPWNWSNYKIPGSSITYGTAGVNTTLSASTASYSVSNLNSTGTTAHVFNTNMLSSSGIETGRIEGGSESNQKFTTSNQDFEWAACSVSEWKIYPDSYRRVEVKEIRNYCSSCGIRMKKQNWKFCPNCGQKF